MAFCFLVNVDQCLNMNNFDFFFYQKRHRNELYITDGVYIGEGKGQPFRKAASDIRMHIDKNPYLINDCQIIVAMRTNYKNNITVWKDTLLSRLLDIDFGLRQADINIRSGNSSQISVNLIMLYETDVITNLNEDEYMTPSRLGRECNLLLREIGVSKGKENDLDELKKVWNDYVEKHASEFRIYEGLPPNPMYVFFDKLLKQYESDKNSEEENHGRQISIFHALKEVLEGYQIFELMTEQNRNTDINSLLKIVEYVTTDYEELHGVKSLSLSEQCRYHWRDIKSTDQKVIQDKYAAMLYRYKNKLSDYVLSEEEGSGTAVVESTLPEYAPPGDKDIGDDDSVFERSDVRETENLMKKCLGDFKNSLTPIESLLRRWEDNYKEMKKKLTVLDEDLNRYAAEMAKKYTGELNKRKKTERIWNNTAYVEGEDTRKEIEMLTEEERDLLKRMDQPQITPSLQFQDQLNMEHALEQENINITHCIKCLQARSGKTFICTAALMVLMTAVCYIILQPYIMKNGLSAMYFGIYIACSAVFMFATWLLPSMSYKRRIIKSITILEECMCDYINGYFKKAQNFRDYINILNRLDYVERHIRLKKSAVKNTEWIVSARTWHINQAKQHIKKLDFFSGLISTYTPDITVLQPNDGDISVYAPNITRDHVDDVPDNKLYWAQS